MKAGPFPLFVLAVGLTVVVPLVLIVSTPGGPPPPLLYCSRDGLTNSYVSVPARNTTVAVEPPFEEGPFPFSWVTIWSNSTAPYSLFLLNGSEWEVYDNSTPPPSVGTSFSAPPGVFFWNSGPVTATNSTLNYSPTVLNWWLLVENPGRASIVVGTTLTVCNEPA